MTSFIHYAIQQLQHAEQAQSAYARADALSRCGDALVRILEAAREAEAIEGCIDEIWAVGSTTEASPERIARAAAAYRHEGASLPQCVAMVMGF